MEWNTTTHKKDKTSEGLDTSVMFTMGQHTSDWKGHNGGPRMFYFLIWALITLAYFLCESLLAKHMVIYAYFCTAVSVKSLIKI